MSIPWRVIEPLIPDGPDDPASMLRDACGSSEPLAFFLEAAASEDQPILLVVNDPDRGTLTRPALAAIAARVNHRGATARPRFHAVVATGTHRFDESTRHEFEERTFADCGLPIQDVTWHDADEHAALVSIDGVEVNRLTAESRFVLAIGSVEPHYHAGVTGPHKTLTVGCLSREAITRNHALALEPGVRPLRLDGNPVFEDICETFCRLHAHERRRTLAIAEVVCGDRLAAVDVGHPIGAVRTLLSGVRRTFAAKLDAPVDLLRLRVRAPLDRTLYQAEKAIKNNHAAVHDGGGILLEADCHDGIGPPPFLKLLCEAAGYEDALRRIRTDGYRLGDHKAVQLHQLADAGERNVRVAVVSPYLDSAILDGTPLALFPDVESALKWLTDRIDPMPTCGVIVEDASAIVVSLQ